jgi:hypothetical protein
MIGYTILQIDTLFESEPDILNVEDALQKLELTPMGYNHKFVSHFGSSCVICNDTIEKHLEFNLQRLQEEDY